MKKLRRMLEPRDMREAVAMLDDTIRILQAEDARHRSLEAARAPARRANRDLER